jgi:hypothetical protein
LRPYLPSFRHTLIDLAQIEDSALSTEVPLRTYLKALKYIQHPNLKDYIQMIFAEVATLPLNDSNTILTYFDNGPVALSNELIAEKLSQLAPETKERIMGWLTQPYFDKGFNNGFNNGFDKGFDKGRAEGEVRGEARGEAKMLMRLLERRFGDLPMTLRERISCANIESIEMWVDRAFDAPDLQSVFEPN